MITKRPAIVTCFGLGSCIGVFIYDKLGRIGGGAHIMLPGDKIYSNLPEKHHYANSGLKDLVNIMRQYGSTLVLHAKLVGGANVLSTSGYQIGERNALAVHQILDDLKVKIISQDLGGSMSRTARFNFPQNIVEVKTSEGKKYII
ncbi:chemotaxis protein CheD [Fulvivirgaceae bacterium BMA10]|uniref:Chemotaxis protein CheD n=2 Tax=Splendidivirga corallicola TaxID=3051826 RepID=A0ABT8KST5_9BACT|nr:chemotaxis protein CheD [Fulvivirgaceae bacterium BMA10]